MDSFTTMIAAAPSATRIAKTTPLTTTSPKGAILSMISASGKTISSQTRLIVKPVSDFSKATGKFSASEIQTSSPGS
jgi:hypothetical protein